MDLRYIPSYCCNILYLPNSRWHLGLLLEAVPVDNKKAAISHYNKVQANHDPIMLR